jgi:hypothetical protein
MKVLNALSAENRWMFTAVKMLDTLVVELAQIRRNLDLEIFVFLICV